MSMLIRNMSTASTTGGEENLQIGGTKNQPVAEIPEVCPSCNKKLYPKRWGQHYVKADLTRIVCPEEEEV